jgi:hypothetical protein
MQMRSPTSFKTQTAGLPLPELFEILYMQVENILIIEMDICGKLPAVKLFSAHIEHMCSSQVGFDDTAIATESYITHRGKFVEFVIFLAGIFKFYMGIAQFFVLQLQFDSIGIEFEDQFPDIAVEKSGIRMLVAAKNLKGSPA